MTRTAPFRLNAIDFWFWFSKECTLIFVRLKLRAALFRAYSLDSICRFYYICGQFVLHLRALLHLWSIFIAFKGFTTFVVNYYICGFNMVYSPVVDVKIVSSVSTLLPNTLTQHSKEV